MPRTRRLGIPPLPILAALIVLLLSACSESGDANGGDAGPPLESGAADVAQPCEAGNWTCSEDGFVLQRCVDGFFERVDCMADHGQLCEQGQCVDPWRFGAPVWPTCDDDPLATSESLVDKASAYDELVERLHLSPRLKWIASVELFKDETPCPAGKQPPCYTARVDLAQATPDDVEHRLYTDNDGLFTSYYMASQAYRYAATGSSQALANLRLLMGGLKDRTAITGVSGLYPRAIVPPDVPGIACPADDEAYRVDPSKLTNRWVKIGDDGCALVVDADSGAWKSTEHCVDKKYADWCFLDNPSREEYTSHVLALVLIWRLVEDPQLRQDAAKMLEQIAEHLMVNDLTVVDWDGQRTEHGLYYATCGMISPGFAAGTALGHVLPGTVASGRQDLRDFYENCLLQKNGPTKCLPWSLEQQRPYTDYLSDPEMLLLFPGTDGCLSPFGTHTMLLSAMFTLIDAEREPARRLHLQQLLDEQMARADSPKAWLKHHNALYDFMWAAVKRLGPGSDGPALDAVRDGICMLRQFPATKTVPALDVEALYPHHCTGRSKISLAEHAIPVAYRCPHKFTWFASDFFRVNCSRKDWFVFQPADYLLPYWMGRYYGFISPS